MSEKFCILKIWAGKVGWKPVGWLAYRITSMMVGRYDRGNGGLDSAKISVKIGVKFAGKLLVCLGRKFQPASVGMALLVYYIG